jgi:uncharacterized phiE125 gp8 family phage protein
MASASLQRWQRQFGRVSVVTAPASAPLDVDDDVKPHLRISHNGEDTKLGNLVSAAVGEIDSPTGWLGRSIITRKLRLTLDAAPSRVVYLPGPPTTEVTKITYRDSDDVITTIYEASGGPPTTDTIGLLTDLTDEPALIWPDADIGWPSDIKAGPDSFRVEYLTGYADAAAVPKVINQWLLMRIGELYRDPEGSVLAVGSTPLAHHARMLDGMRVHA